MYSLNNYILYIGEMVDFVESDKMINIKISGKVAKSNTYNEFSNISFFIHRTSSDKSL